MKSCQLDIPIVFLVFKRPDTTERVFKKIREAQPKQLFIIADGPNSDKTGEVELCEATRRIVEEVDWDCHVQKNFSDVNMGLRQRVASGLTWVFSQVEEAIILEDDCLPNLSFFQFCEECLCEYRDDKRVMMVCGTNLLGEWKADTQSYCFSYHSHCWGWATWRRAWQYYDPEMSLWLNPEIKDRIKDVVCDRKRFEVYEQQFDSVYSNKVNSWALRWLCARLSQSGLAIIPSRNLISNIGFGENATNTFSDDTRSRLSTYGLTFPLKHPLCVARDKGYETTCMRRHNGFSKTLLGRFFRKIRLAFSFLRNKINILKKC